MPAHTDTIATTTPPHNIFARERQVRFLENLSLTGNVRAACRSACICPQTAYRFRRADHNFARAWDAACLAARAQVEQILADRALNGVEEAIYYHGEEVARRTRYDARLLLAHLARLDRMAENADLAAPAEHFDANLAHFRDHGTLAPPEVKARPAFPLADRAVHLARMAAFDRAEGFDPWGQSARSRPAPSFQPAPSDAAHSAGPDGQERVDIVMANLDALTEADVEYLRQRLQAHRATGSTSAQDHAEDVSQDDPAIEDTAARATHEDDPRADGPADPPTNSAAPSAPGPAKPRAKPHAPAPLSDRRQPPRPPEHPEVNSHARPAAHPPAQPEARPQPRIVDLPTWRRPVTARR